MLTVGIFVDAPPPAAVAVEQAVSESCEAVVGPARCPSTRSLGKSSITTWVAVIRPEDTQWSRLSLDFYDRNPQGALLERRVLVFSEDDAVEDRWAGAGAVVAAFVAARDVDASQVADRYRPLPLPGAEQTAHPWAFDIAGLTGSGASEQLFRFGGLLRVSVEVPRAPGMISLIEARYAERGEGAALRWGSGAVGIGARLEFDGSGVGVDFAGQLVFERLSVSARDPETALEDSTFVNRLGGRLEMNLFWQAWPSLGFLLGSDVQLLRPEVAIYERDRYVGLESSVGYVLNAGVRFTP